MCRIAGFASLDLLPNRENMLESMLKAIAHGGPDDSGTYFDGSVALGHRRLSIIDLSSAGHQPMLLNDDLIISYNGELYNYRELKAELEKGGAVFKTQTDTEVILHAYRQWGTEAFGRFEGIFAFALYDKADHKLLLVRDQIGVKPLYYHMANKRLVFGSEVRVFHEFQQDWKENENWKIHFLAFGSIPHPYTTLKGVYQLNPEYFMEINLTDFSYRMQPYRHLQNRPILTNPKEELHAVGDAVRAAVKKNLIADAPLGVFLSGGIDSSMLTLLADQLQDGVKTLSINFDETLFDEHPFQKEVLEKTRNIDHTSYRVSEHMFWENLPEIWKAMDQPTIDGVNAYFISKCAHRDGLKAVLSGLGADEIFGGYASFNRIKWIKRLRSLLFKSSIAKIVSYFKYAYRRLVYLDLPGPVGDYLFLRGIHTPDAIAKLLGIEKKKVWDVLKEIKVEIPSPIDDKEYVSLLESKIYLTNQLLKDTDCMSMWHGLEVRVPFLDINLLNQVALIPPASRYKDASHKHLLIASVPHLLPNSIVHRQKKGFTFPFALWMQRSPGRFKSLMPSGKETDLLLTQFKNGKCHWSKCWSLAVLQQFNVK